MAQLSKDQREVLAHIIEWFKKDKEQMMYITIGGYAGTGKTTLIAVLRDRLQSIIKDMKVGFACYTGKASRVLKQKLTEHFAIYPKDTVGTIHSLIYSPIVNEKQEIVGWEPKKKIDRDLIIIDEASMVDQLIWNHLTQYRVPIIVVGDHGQLPPIKGSFNLVQKPLVTLKTIHRQALHNPIISIAVQAREKGLIEINQYSDKVAKYEKGSEEYMSRMEDLLSNYTSDTLILCGYNRTRIKLNTYIRTALGFQTGEPQSGDRVICLRNNYEKQIYNGMLGTILNISSANEEWYSATIQMDEEDGSYSGLIYKQQFNANPINYTENRSATLFGDLFDYGYALTVHKAQGSQAKRVILFEERFAKMSDDDWKRWLYTGVTRAEEELYVF